MLQVQLPAVLSLNFVRVVSSCAFCDAPTLDANRLVAGELLHAASKRVGM